MKDMIIDGLALFGAYKIGERYWKKNKDRIIRTAADYISDSIKKALADSDSPITINVTLGGHKE